MIALVCSSQDPASVNISARLADRYGLEETGDIRDDCSDIVLYRIGVPPIQADFIDDLHADLIIFLSKHSSASEVPAMTVHSMGNWGKEAKLGGRPQTLSVSAPSVMLSVLQNMNKSEIEIEKTYEATHHGPLLNTPSMFAELGGTRAAMENKEAGKAVADAVYKAANDALNHTTPVNKIVIGIGGGHYPSKFTSIAIEKGYAFSYIMPKYSIINSEVDSISMLEQAVARSSERPDLAVIDWKSINSSARAHVIKELDRIGIGYERA
ncbi:MAG: hypothetical protein KGH64_02200 [Candidatus Micrarchaeota archaeon]|nr:hypothetical protein [Candidatus Micrarchaeota archaeon]MDE1834128.1 hypothetical protein [Candidatus Micrarchaeota archaeon]MDE1859224.1 hypothetical protein [Candidatus Micrarchaeota archaeon]